MDFFSASIYGFIQGLTEFLPVSSSGHLALLPHFLDIKDPGIVFDLAMHMGTALAVLLYFRKEVWRLLKQSFELLKGKRDGNEFALNTIISTFTSVLLILLIQKFANQFGRSYVTITFNLALFGIFMFIADLKGSGERPDGEMENKLHLKEAFLIGVFQAFAIFPGVSRSGATLTIARWMQLSRQEATRYSFLLSLPIIFGGMIYKLPEVTQGAQSFDFLACLWGTAISFLVGITAIHFFLKVIGKIGLAYFAIYRVILGIVLYFLMSSS
jgi:undecaprenyl-diphosphatase